MANQTTEVQSEILTKELFIAGTKFFVIGRANCIYYYDAEKKELWKNWQHSQGNRIFCGIVRRVTDYGFDWATSELNKLLEATSFFSDFETLE
jgi:radical SAM superfamily enzyme with C-terminal helix-hairpin-helix motif